MQLAIVNLQADDLPRIEAHLLRLSADDRSLRFSAGLVTDASVRAYAGRIRHDIDIVIGLVDKHDRLVGLAHGCVYETPAGLHVEAAFSIDAERRGHGFGTRLMEAVQRQAQCIGAARVVGLCAARNLPMRRIFEGAGMTLSREDDEMHAAKDIAPSGVPVAKAAAA